MFLGGSTLYVETSLTEAINEKDDEKNSPSLDLTGQLGDVMKESAKISYTFSKVCTNSFFYVSSIFFINCPVRAIFSARFTRANVIKL